MKVFQLDDYEWWVGESLAACIAAARAACGDDCYDEAEEFGCEVTREEMQKLLFRDDEHSPPRTCTFAEQLAHEISQGGEFPRLFASTET